MDIYTTATVAAVLMAGRAPVWSTQASLGSGSPPGLPTSGVRLEGAVKTLAHVSIREDAAKRTSRISVTTLSLVATYTVTINGIASAYNAGGAGAADLEDVVDGIAAAINGGGAATTVTATAYAASGSGARDCVLVVGDGQEDYSIAVAATGAGALACGADPIGAAVQAWWLPGARAGSTPPTVWATAAEPVLIDRRGFLERMDSGGLDRLYLQVYDKSPHPRDGASVTYRLPVISIGPCLSEVEF